MNKNVGKVNYNKLDNEMILVEWVSGTKVKVYFPKYNSYTWTNHRAFKDGQVKCKFEPRLYKVGYEGEGKYLMYEHGKRTFNYNKWCHILDRTHGGKHNKPCYKDVLLDEEWFNFQNFAEWNEANYYEIEGEEMHLDKDLLSEGVKIYSPNTCVYLPKRLNEVLATEDKEKIAEVLYNYKDLPKWIVELVEVRCEL